jgi:hypothetical protein
MKDPIKQLIEVGQLLKVCDIEKDTWADFLAKVKTSPISGLPNAHETLKELGNRENLNSLTLKEVMQKEFTGKKVFIMEDSFQITITITPQGQYFTQNIQYNKDFSKLGHTIPDGKAKIEKMSDAFTQAIMEFFNNLL